MSLSPKKETNSKEINSNLENSEEPKISQEQISLAEPSTEIGTHLNELTRTQIFQNISNEFRLNSSFNNIRSNQIFPQSQLSAYEEDSGDMNPEDNIFEGDDYDIYNYNELLNSNYERQIPQLSYENVTNMVNSIINFEKNDLINDKDSIKNQIKIFDDFKSKFNKQNKQKKEELKKLFLSSQVEDDLINIKEEKEKTVQIQLSNGEIIKSKLSIFKKYPNSVLAIYITQKNISPKRNGNIFIDRDPDNFKYLLYFLENDKIPNFKNLYEEKKFFTEIDFWKIPLNLHSKNTSKFNPIFNPHFFTFDKKHQIITKSIFKKGILLLNKKLNALNPYIEFSVYINCPNREKKIILALVNENKLEKDDLNKTFDNGVPFVFYWDLFGEKIVKTTNNKEIRFMDLNKFCRCYKDNYEVKFGFYYNQADHSVELIRDDIKLDIKIQNIDPGLTPAFEITNVNCKIKLSQRNKYQDKFFL